MNLLHMPLSEIDQDIIEKTLIHYLEALTREFSQGSLPETAKIDLMNEYACIEKVRDEMDYKQRNAEEYSKSYAYQLNNEVYNRVICSALNYYIQELKDSKEKIRKYHAKIPMDSIEKDLTLANAALDEIMNCDKTIFERKNYK